MSMLSALARSDMGEELLEFVRQSGLPDDWENPAAHSVEAHCTGRILDNKLGAIEVDGPRMNEELLVHLRSPAGRCVLNLNTLLAFATAYVAYQFDAVGRAIESQSKLQQEAKDERKHNSDLSGLSDH